MDEQNERTESGMFSPKKTVNDDERPINIWMIAGLVVLVVVTAVLVLGRHKPSVPPNTPLPLDARASQLAVSQLAMSESTSLSGGKSTFIDGHIKNNGTDTLSAVTVQVFFQNDEQLPPTVETMPMMLIRTHEPYVDTMPFSAAPLKPGDEREFRLVTESVPQNWNVQMPEIHIVHTESQ
ncbi:MAG TPA: DUF2393 family protein [Granulicella sp.]